MMKLTRLVVIAALALAPVVILAQPARAACPVQPSWARSGCLAVTFSDGFGGTSIDTNKWELGWFLGLHATGVSPPVNSAEEACYDSSHVSVAGGSLDLNLTHTASSCGGSHPYTGALIDTRPTFTQAGGDFETNVCLAGNASGKAVGWPAWWSNGPASVPWPQHGEIDTVEGLGGDTAAHLHYGSASQAAYYSPTPKVGCHTFGEAWDLAGKTVTFYWDSARVLTHAFTATYPEYLVLDYSIESGSPSPGASSDMTVNWVRVWK
jgi:hypothetical protein